MSKSRNILITVSNQVTYDQRMQRIADALSVDADVTIVGAYLDEKPTFEGDNYTVKYVKVPFKSGVLFYVFLSIYLIRFILKFKPQTLYTVDLDTALAGIFCKRFIAFNWIFDAHEYFTEVPELEGKPFKKKVWAKVEKIIATKADLRITVNEPLKDIFEKKYNQPYHVIRNVPILNGDFKEPEITEPKTIFYQGAVNKGRGIELVIEAMPQLPHLNFVIAGEGGLFEALSKNTQLKNVQFLGYIKPDDLKQLTTSAWVGVNLLASSSLNYYYSLANKYFDYAAAGVPGISMNFPVYKSLNQDYEVGILIDDLDVNEFVSAIKTLEIEHNYKHYVEECKAARKVWNWSLEAKKLQEIMRALYEKKA